MTNLPTELLTRIVRLLFVSESRSPAALNSVSLSFRSANEIARSIKFRTITVSTYFDTMARREMAENAPQLFLYTKTLRVVRLQPEEGMNFVDSHFGQSCVNCSF